MIKNYITTALRYFVRNRTYSLINLAGLSLGLACVILISVWVSFELSHNKFHENGERIYRLSSIITMSGEENFYPTQHAPVGQMVLEEFPEVEHMTRFSRPFSKVFKHGEEVLMVEEIHYVDSCFFNIFSFDLIEGDIITALTSPNTVVLTERISKMFFGNEMAVGQHLESDGQAYMVTAVVKSPPINSSIQFSILEPMITPFQNHGGFSWGHGMGFETWLLLKEGTDSELLGEKISSMMDQTVNELFKSINATIHGFLEPLHDIYLNSKVERQTIKGDKRTIAIFSVSAILILVIACFNFVNLSTAQGMLRAREVGVRKVFGASRFQLIMQHLGESVLLISIAFVIALLLSEIALPIVELISGNKLNIYQGNTPFLLVGIPLVILIVGIGAGWYPALHLSKFKPIAIIQQSVSIGGKKHYFRNILAFIQFAILQTLAVCSIIVYLQMQHVKKKDIGFEPKNLMVANINSQLLEGSQESLKEHLSSITHIENASLHSFVVGHTILARDFVMEGSPEAQNIAYITVDESFIETYGIELAKGRNFRTPIENEGGSVIVNEAFVRHFDYNNPIGSRIFLPNNQQFPENVIVGIVKDFNFLSLHREVDPLIMLTWHDPFRHLSIKLKDHNLPIAIAEIRHVWSEFAGDSPLKYFFMDDKMNELYIKDFRFGRILGIFTLIAITIACSGLFGLTSHITQSRRREIAIRKVLGATSNMISTMISIGFARWVILGAIIAWPISWVIMSRWLDNFANRIEMPLWAFLMATITSLAIAILTTMTKTIIAANQNPAETLKNE